MLWVLFGIGQLISLCDSLFPINFWTQNEDQVTALFMKIDSSSDGEINWVSLLQLTQLICHIRTFCGWQGNIWLFVQLLITVLHRLFEMWSCKVISWCETCLTPAGCFVIVFVIKKIYISQLCKFKHWILHFKNLT